MAAAETVRAESALTDKGSLVEALWHAVDHAAGNLEAVPGLVRRVLETEAWRKRVHKGKTYEHDRFIDFITAKPLAGCGWSPDKVEALIRNDPVTLTLWREAVTPAKHVHHDTDIISITDGHGTSRSYTLDRLKRQDTELFEKVARGEISANAAAIKAGFRKKLTPFEQIKKLIPKLNATERQELRELLS